MAREIWTTLTFYYLSHGDALLIGALCGTLAEIILVGERQTVRSRLRGSLFWLVYLAIGVTSVGVAQHLIGKLGIKPLVSVDLSQWTASTNPIMVAAGYTVVPFAANLWTEFFYYWFHRLQHAVPFLWRLHSVHHSIQEMNATNDYHHVSEELFRIPVVALPIGLLMTVTVPQMVAFSFFMKINGMLTHANARLSFFWGRYFFAEPVYHRIHHSIEPRHWNKNFGSMFSFWDIVFRTAYFPQVGEYPRTGLPGRGEPASLRDYLFPAALPLVAEKAQGLSKP